MSGGLRERLAGLFVEAPSEAPAERPAAWLPPVGGDPAPRSAAAVVRSLAVLGPARDAWTVGCAAALILAAADDASCGVVAVWTGAAGAALRDRPAVGAARRRAAQLGELGAPVSAAGRLVRVTLPAEEGQACDTARVVLARHEPVVLVITGARGAAMESLVAACDGALLTRGAPEADGLDDLALAALEDLGVPSAVIAPPGSAAAGAGARAGVGVPRALRDPLARALGTGR